MSTRAGRIRSALMPERLQDEYKLREGTIPASIFAVAITHFTAHALDEGQKASQSMEEGEHHMSPTHEDVESWGLSQGCPAQSSSENGKSYS